MLDIFLVFFFFFEEEDIMETEQRLGDHCMPLSPKSEDSKCSFGLDSSKPATDAASRNRPNVAIAFVAE